MLTLSATSVTPEEIARLRAGESDESLGDDAWEDSGESVLMTALSDIAETGIDPLERFLNGGNVFESEDVIRGALDPAETRELLAALRAVDVRALLDPANPDSIERTPDEDRPWQELIEDLAVLREFVARTVGSGRGLYLFMSY